jgi:hypothetical protein
MRLTRLAALATVAILVAPLAAGASMSLDLETKRLQ